MYQDFPNNNYINNSNQNMNMSPMRQQNYNEYYENGNFNNASYYQKSPLQNQNFNGYNNGNLQISPIRYDYNNNDQNALKNGNNQLSQNNMQRNQNYTHNNQIFETLTVKKPKNNQNLIENEENFGYQTSLKNKKKSKEINENSLEGIVLNFI